MRLLLFLSALLTGLAGAASAERVRAPEQQVERLASAVAVGLLADVRTAPAPHRHLLSQASDIARIEPTAAARYRGYTAPLARDGAPVDQRRRE